MTSASSIFEAVPLAIPSLRLLWEAVADVEERVDLGDGPGGHRFLVPVAGGHFRPGPGVEGLSGDILPGGVDRQLLRHDGMKELDACYEMRTDAGIVLSIRNRVLVDDDREPRYAMSRIHVSAPQGPLAWLNRRLIIGTLQSARPQRQAVIIRAWDVDPS